MWSPGIKYGDELLGFSNIICVTFAQSVGTSAEHVAHRRDMFVSAVTTIPVAFVATWVPLSIPDDSSKRKDRTIYIAGEGGGFRHIAIQPAQHEGMIVTASAS